MLSFHFNLYLDLVDFKNIWSKDFGYITKHKCLEMQLMRDSNIFTFEFRLEWSGSDHAGPHISIGLLFHSFDISLYDHRHWDYEAERWQTKEEAVAEAAKWAKRASERANRWENQNNAAANTS